MNSAAPLDSIPYFDATREYARLRPELETALTTALARGDYVLGQEVREFESECACYTGARHAIGVASGTDALDIACEALGFAHPHTEVLVPAFSFIASASCVVRTGGKPVFVDTVPDRFDMDMDHAASLVTAHTRGIAPAHLFHRTADLAGALELARRHKLQLLEDSAEAFGMHATIAGRQKHAGTIGHIGIFSFYPTKTLGGYGDGGLIVTSDDALAEHCRQARNHGGNGNYSHNFVGRNSRLDTLQAALLRVKLRHLAYNISQRKRLAQQYDQVLKGIGDLRLPEPDPHGGGVPYVYSIRTERRDHLRSHLAAHGIASAIYYPQALPLQPAFAAYGHRPGEYPNAEKLCRTVLALPLYPDLREHEQERICRTIAHYFGQAV